jgi:hypothetical protein
MPSTVSAENNGDSNDENSTRVRAQGGFVMSDKELDKPVLKPVAQ